MQAVERLRETLRSLTPSELDGINAIKHLFAYRLQNKSVAELELEIYELEVQATAFGEVLYGPRLKAELEILMARFAAVQDARDARLLVVMQ
jgi:hypothetical protein